MFDHFRDLFKKEIDAIEDTTQSVTLAAAALMVEAARADEHYTEAEQAIIERVMIHAFGVVPDNAATIRTQAEEKQAAANDIHQLTKPLKSLSSETKIAFVEALWRIALSDSARDPYEDMLIRRVAGLIYVTDVESAEARQRVQKEQADQ